MPRIDKVVICNYKGFNGEFTLDLNDGVNILVGSNEAGKSTILEAIHLALSGLVNGRYISNELSQYFFNKEVETEYLNSLSSPNPQKPPTVFIEVYFGGDELPEFEGDGNSMRSKACGAALRIEFDESQHQSDYEELLKSEISTIPLEFYRINWQSFARTTITARMIPIKSVLIDSASTRFRNGSDIYISKIIKDDLLAKEIVDLSQAYRKLKEKFMADDSVEAISKKVSDKVDISTKNISISVDLSSKNSWENSLMTYLDGVPFEQIGKGEQCIIKTNLALAHKQASDSNLILIEEPENHLTHAKLNQLLNNINERCEGKQLVVSTHSSYVANKLNLKNLTLLNSKTGRVRFEQLSEGTYEFFKKLPGYDTLRMLLCEKAVLVEGPSDELIFQRAYKDKNGSLPIDHGIDVISVGLSFERFLEIAQELKKPVAVLTDNDGNFETKVKQKYKKYKKTESIKIFADQRPELPTLEPQIVDANNADLSLICEILELKEDSKNQESIVKYMEGNKTKCALQIFESGKNIKYPPYIQKAISWCNE